MGVTFTGPGGGYPDTTLDADSTSGAPPRFSNRQGQDASPVAAGKGFGFASFDSHRMPGDLDADDLPASHGTAEGHADCVPAGSGAWPGTGTTGTPDNKV